MSIRKAVLPVAGLGTRFLPATKAQPKEMLPIVDKPLVQYAAEEVAASGVPLVIFVTGRGKDAIEDHFDVSVELEQQLAGRGKDDLRRQIHSISGLLQMTYVRQKHALGLWDGSTENATVCQGLLAHLQSRGLRTDRSLLVILDGSKALHKAVTQTLRQAALIRRVTSTSFATFWSTCRRASEPGDPGRAVAPDPQQDFLEMRELKFTTLTTAAIGSTT